MIRTKHFRHVYKKTNVEGV